MPILVWRNAVRWSSWVAIGVFAVFLVMYFVPAARLVSIEAIRPVLGAALGVIAASFVTYATATRWDVDKARTVLADDLSRIYEQPNSPLPVRWTVGRSSEVWSGDAVTFSRFLRAEVLDGDEALDGRVVVLGEAGYGKSLLVTEFAASLLADETVKRVPVVMDVATWNPNTPLWRWISDRLADRYESLRKKIAMGIDGDQPTLADALADPKHMLPVLDGLDVLPRKSRVKVLEQLDKIRSSRSSFVLTCRKKAWDETVSGVRGLPGATIVTLQPLDPVDVVARLNPPAAQWEPVLADPQLSKALAHPATASLVYRSGATPPALLSARGSIREHLIDRFIAATAHDSRWPTEAVSRWLGTLAGHAAQEDGEIRWWRLVTLAPPGHTARVGRWAVTMVFFLTAVAVGWTVAGPIGAIIIGGTLAGLATATHRSMRNLTWDKRDPKRARLPRTPRAVMRVAAVVVAATAVGVAARAGDVGWFQVGGIALFAAVLLGQVLAVPQELRLGTTPATVLAADRTVAIIRGLLIGPAVAALAFLAYAPAGTTRVAVPFAIGCGVTGFVGGISTTAWCRFLMARLWLAAHGLLPWRVMPLLRDAERWGILRPVGAGYEFRDQKVLSRLSAVARVPRQPADPTRGRTPARSR